MRKWQSGLARLVRRRRCFWCSKSELLPGLMGYQLTFLGRPSRCAFSVMNKYSILGRVQKQPETSTLPESTSSKHRGCFGSLHFRLATIRACGKVATTLWLFSIASVLAFHSLMRLRLPASTGPEMGGSVTDRRDTAVARVRRANCARRAAVCSGVSVGLTSR